MVGFILAAGFGTRLKPLTDHIPKALVPVCGITVLDRALSLFNANNIKKIGINAHHHADQLQHHQSISTIPYELFIESPNIRGTAGGLHNAQSLLNDDDVFCVYNADIVCIDFDLNRLRDKFIQSNALVGLVAVPNDNSGTIRYDQATNSYLGTKNETSIGGSADFIGCAFYRREYLAQINTTDFSITAVWQRSLQHGISITVLLAHNLRWYDSGSLSSYKKIHDDVLDGSITLNTSPDQIVDTVNHIAYPSSINEFNLKTISDYSWINVDHFPSTSTIARSIVLKDSIVPENAQIHNQIVTPFGAINLA